LNKSPLISIIVASYNHESFVERCLNSILEEDYPEKEIVIINDGSKDNTDKKIRAWIEQNNHKIFVNYLSRENRGLTATLNQLIDMAKGEYLALLASDDKLINNGIRKRYEYFIRNQSKMAVIGDCNVIDNYDSVIYDSGFYDLFNSAKKNYVDDKKIRKEIISNFSVPGPVLMVKKEIYGLIGKYDENLSLEDFDFYLKAVSKNLLGFIDEKVSSYRRHENSTVATEKFVEIQKSVRKIILKNLHLFNLTEKAFLLREYLFSLVYGSYLGLKYALIKEKESGNFFLGFLLKFLYFIKNIIKMPLFLLLNLKK